MKLSRDAILNASDITTEEVTVPEWGGEVLVRTMTGAERDLYEKSVLVRNGKNHKVNLENARSKLVILTAVDAQGQRLFSNADMAALSKKNAAALDRLFDVAARLAGITEKDMEEIVEELKNDPFDDSLSD